jgi:hypothetical protein
MHRGAGKMCDECAWESLPGKDNPVSAPSTLTGLAPIDEYFYVGKVCIIRVITKHPLLVGSTFLQAPTRNTACRMRSAVDIAAQR